MGVFDGIKSLFSKKEQTQLPTQTQTETPPKQPYTYMYPCSLIKFKNKETGVFDIDGINAINVKENNSKVINPNIFNKSACNLPKEVTDAVEKKIQEQYDYKNRAVDFDGTTMTGGKRRRRKTRKIIRRKSRNHKK